MSSLTIQKLADTLKKDVADLLCVTKECGLPHASPDDTLDPKDQMAIVKALSGKNTSQVVKKETSTLYSKSGTSVTVDVSKRVYAPSGTQHVDADLPTKTTNATTKKKTTKKSVTVADDAPTKTEIQDTKTQKPQTIDTAPSRKKAADASTVDGETAETKATSTKKKMSKTNDTPVAKNTVQVDDGDLSLEEGKKEKKKIATKKTKSRGGATVEVQDVRKLVTEVIGEEIGKKTSKQAANAKGSKKKIVTAKIHAFTKPSAPVVRTVTIGETISVQQLAKDLSVKSANVIQQLMKLGIETGHQDIDQETAILVTEELGHKAIAEASDSTATLFQQDEPLAGNIVSRAPVVAIMGHVDHGKTSLLDYIRKTKVADGEAGGITQHIGAYRVTTKKGSVTFLDTPGHAAFTAMRSRGAEMTDIVLLIVAADDGIMPQTIEAIEHAKASNATIIVVITKVDKATPDLEKIKSELSAHHLVAEDWGGDTPIVQVSSHTGEGIDTLLETIVLHAEVLELKTSTSQVARGFVIEARLDKHKGPVAHVLVTNGELKVGSHILAGVSIGKVRSMIDEHGKVMKQAGAATAVEILGLDSVPEAGDAFVVITDDKQAQAHINRTKEHKQQAQGATPAISLQAILAARGAEKKMLNFIIRADVKGTLEAIVSTLEDLVKENEQVGIKIISAAAGTISEADVVFAAASDAIILGFHVRADAKARAASEKQGIEIRYYSVIYNLVEDIENLVSGLEAKEKQEVILGLAEVKDVFHSPKFGQVAGCIVTQGSVIRSKPIRVLRDQKVIFTGVLSSLRRYTQDVEEVKHGTECGMGVQNYKDIVVGDQIEVYETE